MDKEQCKYIRQVIAGAIEQALIDEDIEAVVSLGNAKYDFTSITFHKVKISMGSEAEAIVNHFNKHCSTYGLRPHHLNQEFEFRFERYILTGLSPNRHKYPLKIKQVSNGKGYGGPKQMIQRIKDAYESDIQSTD